MASKKEEVQEVEVKEEKNEKDLLKTLMKRMDALEAENKELKAQAQPVTKAELDERSKKFEEKVSFSVPKDKGILKEDLFVCVNGKSVLIRRGKNVVAPKKFKRVVDMAEKQRAAAIDLIDQETSKYDQAITILGL